MAAVFHKVVRELSSLRYPLAATRIALRGLCALASCFYLRQRPDFYGNTAQFPPYGLSTVPAAAAPRSPYRHLELCGIALTGTTDEMHHERGADLP